MWDNLLSCISYYLYIIEGADYGTVTFLAVDAM
jgi:hypothetical protein